MLDNTNISITQIWWEFYCEMFYLYFKNTGQRGHLHQHKLRYLVSVCVANEYFTLFCKFIIISWHFQGSYYPLIKMQNVLKRPKQIQWNSFKSYNEHQPNCFLTKGSFHSAQIHRHSFANKHKSQSNKTFSSTPFYFTSFIQYTLMKSKG